MPTNLQDMSPLIVVGMHRSGTGLLTSILEQFGIFMGINQSGNKEALFFQKINKEALDMLACNWRCVDLLPETYDMHHHYRWLKKFMERNVQNGIEDEYFGGNMQVKTWGWKDPRNSLLLPFWNRIFPKAKVVHIIRDGRDSSLSLISREIKREECKTLFAEKLKHRYTIYLDLWEFYLDRIFQSIQSFSTNYTIRFEDLLENPEAETMKLANGLFLENIPVKTKDLFKDIREGNTKRYLDSNFIWAHELSGNHPLLKELGYI